MNILIVEDGREVARAIAQSFSGVDLVRDLHMVQTYDDALSALAQRHYDVFLLDIHLQHSRNGLELCRAIRQQDQRAIIVFISGYIDEQAVKEIYAAGGNDLIRKPFARCEIKLKVTFWWTFIKAGRTKKTVLTYHSWTYDLQRGEFRIDGEVIPLTKAFRRLVVLFLESPEAVIPTARIQQELWGDHDTSLRQRNVKERIFEFRKRLPGKHAEWVRAVAGEGYVLKK